MTKFHWNISFHELCGNPNSTDFVEIRIRKILWKMYFPSIHLHLHSSGKQFSTNFIEKCRWKGYILWKTEFHIFCGKRTFHQSTYTYTIVENSFPLILWKNVDEKVEFCGKLNSIHFVENVLSTNISTLSWKIVFHKFYGK